MKKLIFLLILAVLMAGIMPAHDAAHPPGALALGVAMPGYGVHQSVISPDTVSGDMLNIELFSENLASPDFYIIDVPAGQPQYYILMKPIEVTGQGVFIPPNWAGPHLRL